MPSSDFSTVLVKDDRLANLTDQITYAVNKGAQQISVADFNATSQSNSSHVYNIIVPSLETIIDRRVEWTSTVTLKITSTCAANKQAINYGNRDVLGPFPLHQLIQTMSATINNNTVSLNVRDVLPAMLRLLDNRELAHYNNSTPVAYDQYRDYANMGDALNSSFGGFNLVSDPLIHPRGSFALDWVAADAGGTTPLATGAAAGAPREAYVRFTVTEPLLLSPFIFANPQSNNQGIYGVQNMSFNMNFGDTSRIWRHTGDAAAAITSVEIVEFKNSKLSFNFLTAHPSDQLSSRCVVPFYEMPRYLTSQFPAIVGAPPGQLGIPSVPTPATLVSQTISLNQIPDKLIIFVRPTANANGSDFFLPIRKININWNNNTGVCSSFNQVDLWRCSVESGSNQSFDEFRGYAQRPTPVVVDDEKNAGAGGGIRVLTCGSVLALTMGTHVNLVEDYYAPGSIGQFSIQLSVEVDNHAIATGGAVPPGTPAIGTVTPELVIVCMNSGSFATERGTSSTYTALLTKQDVLDASMQEAVPRGEYTRLVGGGFLDSLKSAWKYLTSHGRLGKIANTALNVHDIYKGAPTAHSTKARNVVQALGGARSGGAMSGGMASLSSRLR